LGRSDASVMAWESLDPLAVRNPDSGAAAEEPLETASVFAFCRPFELPPGVGLVSAAPPSGVKSDLALVSVDTGCMLRLAEIGTGTGLSTLAPSGSLVATG
jgi:hypothetical protein